MSERVFREGEGIDSNTDSEPSSCVFISCVLRLSLACNLSHVCPNQPSLPCEYSVSDTQRDCKELQMNITIGESKAASEGCEEHTDIKARRETRP